MGRPREFDERAVLDQAVRDFWARGYAATSIRDLESGTGLGIASLYNAFGGKRKLFCAALERYSEQQTFAFIRDVEGISSPAERIRTFVDRITEAALDDPHQLGCLMINTATELGSHDPEIAAIVAADLAEVEAFFRRNFEAAQKAGDAAPHVTPEDAGRCFSALMFGLRVLARSRPDRETMEGAARPLLALLRDGSRLPAEQSDTHETGEFPCRTIQS